MIKTVTIKNYILIDDITLEFDKGFNVFTGETGAGKSIIIGAIDSALGAKISKDVIKSNADKAYIELLIELQNDFDKSILNDNGIEVLNNELVISREILPSANRFRINGIMVTQDFIKEIREKLLDIHTQHQNYNYVQPKNHIILLDNFADKEHKERVEIFKEKYHKLLQLNKNLEEAKTLVNNASQHSDLLKFQIKEIEDAQITDINECETLEKELDILSNIEKLKELSYSSYWSLYGDDSNIIDAMSNIKTNISKLAKLDESTSEIEENFNNTYENLKEIANSLRNYSESKENDNERMDIICERLSLLDKLKRKYGNSLQDILNTYQNLSQELESIECSQDNIIHIEKAINNTKSELNELGQTISNTRTELAKTLSDKVTKELEKLELPKSRFNIEIIPSEMTEKGMEKVEFYISTNVSEDLKPISKVASGGEISRIMLAIKTIFANADKTNTVIFDEIDTGISGKASQVVADSISNLSKSHQIILITHQPIIASKADSHFYVKKEQTDITKVKVYNLQGENRVKAIALLAAGEINEESESFARTLLAI